jgi:hypothetical protein
MSVKDDVKKRENQLIRRRRKVIAAAVASREKRFHLFILFFSLLALATLPVSRTQRRQGVHCPPPRLEEPPDPSLRDPHSP